jgi:hypothetical protein
VAVHLVFGDTGPYTVPPGGAVPLRFNELLVDGGLPGGGLPVFGSGPVRLPWGRVVKRAAKGPGAPWGTISDRAARGFGLPWESISDRAAYGPRLPWEANTFGGGNGFRAPWNAATSLDAYIAELPWNRASVAQRDIELPWDAADPRHRLVGLPWQRARRTDPNRVVVPWQPAAPRRTPAQLPWGAAELRVARNKPLPVPPGEYGQHPGANAHLHFCVLTWDTHLVLGRENCIRRGRLADGTAITARRSYVQTHSLTALRLPDLTPVPVTSFSLSADADNIGWTVSINGPTDLLTLLAPVAGLPARLRLTIDGLVWEFVVEGLRRNRSFGATDATATGRSASALLAEPYRAQRAFLNAVPMTAQQILEEALEFTGVSLTWQVTDWLVPAGAWSHTGTPMSAVRRVAESVGALVQSPRVGEAVIVAPRYPVLPWDWAAADPDVTMVLDPVATEGYERADRPAYEGVYVSGQAQGVLALVKRTGTAPASDKMLPLVTDALMTHLDAARQRGEALLGAAGPRAQMTLSLPVLTGVGEPGVIDVGKLVLVSDPAGAWRGLVRSVAVASDGVVVRQTITLERHL